MDKYTIAQNLPQFNCGACGYKTCNALASAVAKNEADISLCTVLNQQRFKKQKNLLLQNFGNSHAKYSFCPSTQEGQKSSKEEQTFSKEEQTSSKEEQKFSGLIDHACADLILHPLKGEKSCRETLAYFTAAKLKVGMTIKYRPLGCPITHFATIIEINHGLIDVLVTGPPALLHEQQNNQSSNNPIDLGICMILSFQGEVETRENEENPPVGQTVKFLPAHCMMGKVHSGIIVSMEESNTRIDCIDLKIWNHTTLST